MTLYQTPQFKTVVFQVPGSRSQARVLRSKVLGLLQACVLSFSLCFLLDFDL